MDLETELQRIYDSEINVRIGWLWDGGIVVRLGDEVNGFRAEETVASVADILPWLQEAVAHFYPDSTYGQSLDPAVRERAAQRLFKPPATDISVRCPHCNAANAGTPGMDELIKFTCSHCGCSISVDFRRLSG